MSSDGIPIPVAHVRPADGEAQELLGFERAMFVMRLVGFIVVVSQAPLYPDANLGLVALALGVVAATLVVQRLILDVRMPLAELRRRSVYLLIGDVVAVYIIGTAFLTDTQWIGFYFYPLVALEGAVVAGMWGGIGVTVVSVIVYLVQVGLHASLGYAVTLANVVGGLALVGFTGGFMAAFGLSVERGRRDLRVLLDLTTVLAHQQDESETMEVLDRRLEAAVGARVRSVAVRRADGRFEIVRWHSSERRMLDRDTIEPALGNIDALAEQFVAGVSLTWDVDPSSRIATSLGLPDWARSVTLVPMFLEGAWVGVLPVLWPSHTVPDSRRLGLLYGLANQMGLSLSQGQLQRVREEAATDPLTGLLNRRAILGELNAAIARAGRSGGTVSILFCDLDSFKQVNDTRGHDAGDAVLRAVGGAVRNSVRQGDVVGRYGGDELLVIAADTAAEGALALAARIRNTVHDLPDPARIDVTIGISVYPLDARTPRELLAAADRAMYRGKLAGSGQVVAAADPDPGPVLAEPA